MGRDKEHSGTVVTQVNMYNNALSCMLQVNILYVGSMSIQGFF